MHIKKPGMMRNLIHYEPSTNSPIFLPFGVIQFGHFFKFAKEKCKDPYPVEPYATESIRLLGVLEKCLEGREYLIDDGINPNGKGFYTIGHYNARDHKWM